MATRSERLAHGELHHDLCLHEHRSCPDGTGRDLDHDRCVLVGIIDDFWQRAITNVGLPGPDQDKGGKFLLLPPGYDGQVPQDGYHVLRATMNNYNLMVRGLVVNDDVPAAVQLVRQMKVSPWSERDNPKANKFVSISGK